MAEWHDTSTTVMHSTFHLGMGGMNIVLTKSIFYCIVSHMTYAVDTLSLQH